MADVLVFSKMAQINEMKANYKKLEDIAIDIRRTELDEFLKFDSNGWYGFFRCEACAGPILGHLEVKCRGLNGERYDALTTKSFEDWLERIAEFRQAIAERERKRQEAIEEREEKKADRASKDSSWYSGRNCKKDNGKCRAQGSR